MQKPENVIIGIYKITSPSNRIYIGQSTNIYSRYKNYRNRPSKHQPKIYNSILKYGWNEHQFEIIEECSAEQLNELEIYWKTYYLEQVSNDWKEVLFCSLYDGKGGHRSAETRLKISKSMTGNKRSEETNLKISISKKGVSNTKREIFQYDLEGNFIKEWHSVKDIANNFNANPNSFTLYMSGKNKTFKGYIFKREK